MSGRSKPEPWLFSRPRCSHLNLRVRHVLVRGAHGYTPPTTHCSRTSAVPSLMSSAHTPLSGQGLHNAPYGLYKSREHLRHTRAAVRSQAAGQRTMVTSNDAVCVTAPSNGDTRLHVASTTSSVSTRARTASASNDKRPADAVMALGVTTAVSSVDDAMRIKHEVVLSSVVGCSRASTKAAAGRPEGSFSASASRRPLPTAMRDTGATTGHDVTRATDVASVCPVLLANLQPAHGGTTSAPRGVTNGSETRTNVPPPLTAWLPSMAVFAHSTSDPVALLDRMPMRSSAPPDKVPVLPCHTTVWLPTRECWSNAAPPPLVATFDLTVLVVTFTWQLSVHAMPPVASLWSRTAHNV